MDTDPHLFFHEIFGSNSYSELGIDFSAERILVDCFRKGFSSKWTGSCDNYKLLQEKLLKFNVANVDDSYKEWRLIENDKTKRSRRRRNG